MAREFLTYVRKFADMSDGRRILYVKDLAPGPRKYDARLVLADVARGEAGEQADTLWVRSETGVLDPEPWTMRILKELPDRVAGTPYEDVFAALKRLQMGVSEIALAP